VKSSSLTDSFRYAWHGLRDAWRAERNIRVHVLAAFLVLYLAWLLEVRTDEFVVLCMVSGMVIVAEMANTALEALIDLVIKKHDPLAKTAKNAAAGAVLVTSIAAVLVGIAVFGSRFANYEEQIAMLRAKLPALAVGAALFILLFVVSVAVPLSKKSSA